MYFFPLKISHRSLNTYKTLLLIANVGSEITQIITTFSEDAMIDVFQGLLRFGGHEM